MGLFDFTKEIGKKLGDNMDLAKELRESGITIENQLFEFSEGTATISGKVDSQADREKVILTLGHIEGVEKVVDNLEVENPAEESKFYTVKPGDTLSKIAKSFYGNAMKYPEIFEANKPMLKDPNKITPGQVLRIPAL
jgi:nucleoid-associated protein YgaU